jgi:hypothetical protein
MAENLVHGCPPFTFAPRFEGLLAGVRERPPFTGYRIGRHLAHVRDEIVAVIFPVGEKKVSRARAEISRSCGYCMPRSCQGRQATPPRGAPCIRQPFPIADGCTNPFVASRPLRLIATARLMVCQPRLLWLRWLPSTVSRSIALKSHCTPSPGEALGSA